MVLFPHEENPSMAMIIFFICSGVFGLCTTKIRKFFNKPMPPRHPLGGIEAGGFFPAGKIFFCRGGIFFPALEMSGVEGGTGSLKGRG